MIGELTRYEKKTVTFPNSTGGNQWAQNAQISCSFEPKFLLIYGGDDSVAGNIYCGEFEFDHADNGKSINLGAVRYRNKSNNTLTFAIFSGHPIDGESHTGGAGKYQYYDNTISICWVNSNGIWSSTDSYTVEIYG